MLKCNQIVTCLNSAGISILIFLFAKDGGGREGGREGRREEEGMKLVITNKTTK